MIISKKYQKEKKYELLSVGWPKNLVKDELIKLKKRGEILKKYSK